MHPRVKSISVTDEKVPKHNPKDPKNPYMYYRARINFYPDEETGFTPPSKDRYGETKREAREKANLWVPEKKGIDKTVSFLAYLTEEFLVKEKKRTVESFHLGKPISYKHFEDRQLRLNNFVIIPISKQVQNCAIRHAKLAYLKPVHFEELFAALISEGLSANYYRLLRTDLRMALRACHKRLPELVAAYFAELPQAKPKKKEKKHYQPELIYGIIQDETKDVSARALVAFEIMLLGRNSELAALTAADVDWDTGIVILNKSLRKVGPNEFRVKRDTKGGEPSNRAVEMPPFLLDLLKRHMARTWGGIENFPKNAPLFTTAKGKLLDSNKFKGHWKQVQAKLGLEPDVSFYSLKSSGNSYFQALGLSAQDLRFMMGHSTTSIMLMTNYRVPVKTESQRRLDVTTEALAAAQRSLPYSGQKGGKQYSTNVAD